MMKTALFLSSIAVLAAVCLAATPATQKLDPKPNNPIFFENFQGDWQKQWIVSADPKYNGDWSVESHKDYVADPEDKSLVITSPARHYGISAAVKFDTQKTLVVQYEVRLQKTLECGGAYLKLLAKQESNAAFNPKELTNDTPYTIMFGPDVCGFSTNRVHFIIRHKSAFDGSIEEKHLKDAPTVVNDGLSHLYTLVLRPDDTFDVLIDGVSKRNGSLLTDGDFHPSVNPPKEIDDPEDKKPENWDDKEKIADPEATKPEDWDETAPAEIVDPEDTKPAEWLDDAPATVADPEAVKPDGWDDSEDGAWEAPQIPNPACQEFGCGVWSPRKIRNPEYKGKWHAPMIANPNYQGVWAPKKIPNPKYKIDPHPAKNLMPMQGIAIEVWTMTDQIAFDNILITNSEEDARSFADKTWAPKLASETAQKEAATTPSLASKAAEAVGQVIEAGTQNPIYVAVAAFALLLLSLFCCCRGGGDMVAETRAAAPKKTEESDEDVTPVATSSSAAPAGESKASKRPKKAE